MEKEETQTEVEDEIILPPTYLAVLYFVANSPKYGYQIKQLLEERNYQLWVDIKVSSIYKGLRELQKRGLIQSKKVRESLQPSRRIYSITAQGREVFRQQVFRLLSQPPQPNRLFDLGLSSMMTLSRTKILAALRAYRRKVEERFQFLQHAINALENFETLQKTNPGLLVGKTSISRIPVENLGVIHALFEHPCYLARAELQWLNTFIQRVEINPKFPIITEF